MNDQRFASRKFVLTAALLAYAMFCNALGIPANPQWLSFLTWALGLYFGGNLGAAAISKLYGPSKPQ